MCVQSMLCTFPAATEKCTHTHSQTHTDRHKHSHNNNRKTCKWPSVSISSPTGHSKCSRPYSAAVPFSVPLSLPSPSLSAHRIVFFFVWAFVSFMKLPFACSFGCLPERFRVSPLLCSAVPRARAARQVASCKW